MGTITSQINTKFINVGPSIIPSSPFLSTTSSKNEQIGKKKIYKKCIYCDGSGTKYDIKYFLENEKNATYTKKIQCGYCNGVGYTLLGN